MSHLDDEAIQADTYLDWLLATHGGTAAPGLVHAGSPLDPELIEAVGVLDRSLVRFHPSFRFEERLAATLAAAAAGTTGASEPIAIAGPAGPAVPLLIDRRGRSLLLSGAIASGVSLAGAALFAWRRSRPPATAFGRAARAAHGLRRDAARTTRQRLSRERLA